MTKLLCLFIVVSLTSFKRIETNLLGNSAIGCNQFELIVIFAILFLKCVATKNFCWNTCKYYLIFWDLSRKNCPGTDFSVSSPLALGNNEDQIRCFLNSLFPYLIPEENKNGIYTQKTYIQCPGI